MMRVLGLLLVVTAGCGNISRKSDGDAGPRDGGIDAFVPLTDAMGDAPTDAPPVPPQSREVLNGAGVMSGTTFTFEVQIGNPINQKPSNGATFTFEGNATVKP